MSTVSTGSAGTDFTHTALTEIFENIPEPFITVDENIGIICKKFTNIRIFNLLIVLNVFMNLYYSSVVIYNDKIIFLKKVWFLPTLVCINFAELVMICEILISFAKTFH